MSNDAKDFSYFSSTRERESILLQAESPDRRKSVPMPPKSSTSDSHRPRVREPVPMPRRRSRCRCSRSRSHTHRHARSPPRRPRSRAAMRSQRRSRSPRRHRSPHSVPLTPMNTLHNFIQHMHVDPETVSEFHHISKMEQYIIARQGLLEGSRPADNLRSRMRNLRDFLECPGSVGRILQGEFGVLREEFRRWEKQ